MKKSLLYAATGMLMVSCDTAPDYDATGIFEATTVTVSAETSGKILSLDCAEGDSLTAGSEIAVIDTSLLVLQLKQITSQRL